jgi:hypothetical protein
MPVPYAMKPASLLTSTFLAAGAMLVAYQVPAHAGRADKASGAAYSYDNASDLHDRVSRSYSADRRPRRSTANKAHKRERNLAYPNSPWGPFAGPPGLF